MDIVFNIVEVWRYRGRMRESRSGELKMIGVIIFEIKGKIIWDVY